MYSASTPVIAMKPIGCWRFPECPRAGGAGRVIFFKGRKGVPWTRANRDDPGAQIIDPGRGAEARVQQGGGDRVSQGDAADRARPVVGDHDRVDVGGTRCLENPTRAKWAMCIYRRKLRLISRKKAAKYCCSRPSAQNSRADATCESPRQSRVKRNWLAVMLLPVK
jgi:hypothetical protein